MIGRSLHRSAYLVVSILTASVLGAGFVTHPVPAVAAAVDLRAPTPAGHVVLFDSQGTQTQHVTSAATVGDFLKERGISPAPGDLVRPDASTPLVDNVVIRYAPAIPVKIVTPTASRTVVTTAPDVGALLEEQNIELGRHDIVSPSLSDRITAQTVVRISSVEQWAVMEKHHIAVQTIRKIDFNLPPGTTKLINRGEQGLTVTMVRYTRTDGKLDKLVLGRRLVRKPHDRILAEGIGTLGAIAYFAHHGLEKASYIAASALNMIATAYTAACSGCSGYTASGFRAGRGIVAVDPRVIPLGTKLYIPGYGFAIAGDTGGAIVGSRIDLGFNNIGDALSFGRRTVKVYRLR